MKKLHIKIPGHKIRKYIQISYNPDHKDELEIHPVDYNNDASDYAESIETIEPTEFEVKFKDEDQPNLIFEIEERFYIKEIKYKGLGLHIMELVFDPNLKQWETV